MPLLKPLAIEPYYTLREVAQLLELSLVRVRRWLYERPDLFRVRYRRIGQHPRRHRILTSQEVRLLQSLIVRGPKP